MSIFGWLFREDNAETNDTDSWSENKAIDDLKATFPSLVESAASGIYSLQYVSVDGRHVNAVFNSKSGKTTWECDLYFDDGNDNFTEDYSTGIAGMPGAYAPVELANAIINEVRWSQNWLETTKS